MWKSQKGFSLVEAVIIIALLGVLIGSSVAMIGHIRYANTKKVAEEVDKALSKLRLETMSREERQYLYIYEWTDGYYVKLLDESVEPDDTRLNGGGTRLCGKNVTFSMDGKLVTDKTYICVAYKKNGLFQTDKEDTEDITEGTNTESITISGSGTYTIRLDYETGRHYFE